MKSVDENSLENAYRLFDSGYINKIEIGTVKGYKKYIDIYLKDYMILLEKLGKRIFQKVIFALLIFYI